MRIVTIAFVLGIFATEASAQGDFSDFGGSTSGTASSSTSTSSSSSPSSSGGRGLGIGALGMLTGPAGLQGTYDMSKFHIEALFLYFDDGMAPSLGVAGRFWFHLHETDRSTFSIGGGFGLTSTNPPGPDNTQNVLHIEGGAQIRFFVVDNVAITTDLGLAINAADGEGFFLGAADLYGAGGITYFF